MFVGRDRPPRQPNDVLGARSSTFTDKRGTLQMAMMSPELRRPDRGKGQDRLRWTRRSDADSLGGWHRIQVRNDSRKSRIGYLEHPDDDTVITARVLVAASLLGDRCRSPALIIGAIVALVVLARSRRQRTPPAAHSLIGFGGGYFGGAIAWAILSARSVATCLQVRFDMENDTAHVYQSHPLDLAARLVIQPRGDRTRSIFGPRRALVMQRLAPTHIVALSRFNKPIAATSASTRRDIEADEIVRPLGTLLEIPVRENPPQSVGG